MGILFHFSAQLSTSLNTLVPTDSPELVNDVLNSTSHERPNTLRARTGTLARAATIMMTHKPLAPPPTVLQSLKAILVASCSCYVFVKKFRLNALLGLNILLLCIPVSVCIQPEPYVRVLIYSSNSGLCILPCLHQIHRIPWFSSVSFHVSH